MKINDILHNISNIAHKAIYAKGIRECNSIIKKAISDYYSKGTFDPIEYGIKTNNEGGIVSISSSELQDLYKMEPLEALLFLDSVAKADTSSDKTKLQNLLRCLTAGKHIQGPAITPQMLETIKVTQPKVWEQYQALCDKAQKEEEMAIAEMNSNLNEEI